MDDAASGRANALSVARGLLVAFNHADWVAGAKFANHALKRRGLAGSWGTHQIARQNSALVEPSPVALGKAVVFRQDVLFKTPRSAGGLCIKACGGLPMVRAGVAVLAASGFVMTTARAEAAMMVRCPIGVRMIAVRVNFFVAGK